MLADDLVDALTLHPDSTALELASRLAAADHRIDEGLVTRILHSAHGRFRSDRGSPARWRAAGLVAEDAATDRESVSAPDPMTGEPAPPLYRWQNEALVAWKRAGRRGVVEAVTGAGKTMVGVSAVLEQRRTRGQALVLVPNRELQAAVAGHIAQLVRAVDGGGSAGRWWPRDVGQPRRGRGYRQFGAGG